MGSGKGAAWWLWLWHGGPWAVKWSDVVRCVYNVEVAWGVRSV